MSEVDQRSEIAARGRSVRPIAQALALIVVLLAIVLLAPADAATTTTDPGASALQGQPLRDRQPAASFGDQAAVQQRGISWAARSPKRTSAIVLFIVVATFTWCAASTPARSRPPRALRRPRARPWSSAVVSRAPPHSLARP